MNKDTKAEAVQRLKEIEALCNTPHWTSDRRWRIQALSSNLRTLLEREDTTDVQEVEAVGVEFGFKCHEKGMNLEATFLKLQQLKEGK